MRRSTTLAHRVDPSGWAGSTGTQLSPASQRRVPPQGAPAPTARHSCEGAGGATRGVEDAEEARTAAVALRQRSADVLTSANPKEVAAALKLRNQLARLLMDRIRAVRSAAAYVFRSHPAVVRSFASACERRRRSASRRRAAAEAAAKAALEEAMKGAEAKAKGTS